jgi:hypothetical protein
MAAPTSKAAWYPLRSNGLTISRAEDQTDADRLEEQRR